MNNYYHKYKGIVVQNSDPSQYGRVKVFVPEINMNLYKDWNSDKTNDEKFTELGGNLNSLPVDILRRLCDALPWALVLQPIFGCTATLYHRDVDTAIIGDDADSSVQQKIINKEPAASLPENNDFSAFGKALAASATPATNSANALNFYPDSSSGLPSYIQNAATASVNISAIPVVNTINTPFPTIIPANGNIAEIIITFGGRPGRNKLFTSTASLQVDSAPAFTGSASTWTGGFTKNPVNVFTQKAPIVDPVINTVSTNDQNTGITNYVTDNTKEIPATFPVEVVPYSPPINYSLTSTPPTYGESNITITLAPLRGNNVNKRFSTSASLVTYDGTVLNAASLVGTGKRKAETVSSTVYKDQITDINIGYIDPNQPVDLTHPAIGQVANLLAEYGGNGSVGMTNSPIVPPSTVGGGSGSSKSKYNRGGGGSEIFSGVASKLMPPSVLKNTLMGQANPNSLQATNYRRPINNGSDPNKTVGQNQQTAASTDPPIRPPSQGNKAKGIISIPEVGASVSVYFDNGNPMCPIVDGVFYTAESYKGIHDVKDSLVPTIDKLNKNTPLSKIPFGATKNASSLPTTTQAPPITPPMSPEELLRTTNKAIADKLNAIANDIDAANAPLKQAPFGSAATSPSPPDPLKWQERRNAILGRPPPPNVAPLDLSKR